MKRSLQKPASGSLRVVNPKASSLAIFATRLKGATTQPPWPMPELIEPSEELCAFCFNALLVRPPGLRSLDATEAKLQGGPLPRGELIFVGHECREDCGSLRR